MVTKLNRQKVNRTKQEFRLPPEVLSDLHLMLKFIDRVRAGISMNLLVHRSIEAYLRTDACFFGLGWLCWCCGRAYRLEIPEIPPERWLTKPQNFMEFLGLLRRSPRTCAIRGGHLGLLPNRQHQCQRMAPQNQLL
jgi:hypothetical protein